MNPIFREAALHSDFGWLLGLITGLFFAFFLGQIFFWFRKSVSADVNEAASMPLSDQE